MRCQLGPTLAIGVEVKAQWASTDSTEIRTWVIGKLPSTVSYHPAKPPAHRIQSSWAPAQSLQSCLTLCTPWTVARQAPLSVGFSRQEYWGELPFSSSGDLPDPGIEPTSPVSSAWQANSLPLKHLGSPIHSAMEVQKESINIFQRFT